MKVKKYLEISELQIHPKAHRREWRRSWGEATKAAREEELDYVSIRARGVSNMARQNARAYDSYILRVVVISDGGRSNERVS
jgi:hypothetical protein